MQIRCSQCHKPFAMGKEAIYAALDEVSEEEMSHFNIHCPHCRRANRVSRDELLRAAPDWKKQETNPTNET